MERFNSSFKGYNIHEVNRFVDDMTREYGLVLEKLKSKDSLIEHLNSEISELKKRLEKNSIISTYNANEELSRMAKNEARMIIDDAKKNASRIVNDALLEAEKIEFKTETMRRNMVVFKRRMRTIVKSQLETIEDIEEIKLDE